MKTTVVFLLVDVGKLREEHSLYKYAFFFNAGLGAVAALRSGAFQHVTRSLLYAYNTNYIKKKKKLFSEENIYRAKL